jgi:excisionase family DNA binding protein
MTIEETAKYLRCSERFIRDLVAGQQIPFCMFAGKAIFHPQRLDEWLLSQERTPKAKSGQEIDSKIEDADTIEVKETVNREEVEGLLKELIEYKSGNERFVNGLGLRLKKELTEYDYKYVSIGAYSRLSKWCWPHRHSEREKWVEPRVHRLSKILFGKVIDRIYHPTYRK